MAVTKIWGVYGSEKHENISRSIKYAANDAKTVERTARNMPGTSLVSRVSPSTQETKPT